MRVVLLSHFGNYWTRPYARHLASNGHQVLAVGFDQGSIPDVESVTIGVQPWTRHKYAYLTRAPAFGRLARRFRADVVLATYVVSNGLTAALGWRGPLVVSAHGYDLLVEPAYSGWRAVLRRRLAAAVCRRATLVHVVSDQMVAAAARLGVPASKIAVIPVGIDLARFPARPPGAPARLGPTPRLICTRRHEAVYDNETVLAALALLTRDGVPVEATFVGGGPLTARYREAAAQRGITSIVRFVGEQPHERLPVLLAEADIYVSASRVDGTSSALLEAMASGLLPVVSRIPANQAWVEDGIGGLLFEPGDAGALAAALRRALDDDELRLGALGVNRRRVETDGSLAANLERLEALLERAVADTAAAG